MQTSSPILPSITLMHDRHLTENAISRLTSRLFDGLLKLDTLYAILIIPPPSIVSIVFINFITISVRVLCNKADSGLSVTFDTFAGANSGLRYQLKADYVSFPIWFSCRPLIVWFLCFASNRDCGYLISAPTNRSSYGLVLSRGGRDVLAELQPPLQVLTPLSSV